MANRAQYFSRLHHFGGMGNSEMTIWPNNGAAANRRYAGQLDDFMKFDCQDCIRESRSAAVAELGR
jgi:hypothetical protein